MRHTMIALCAALGLLLASSPGGAEQARKRAKKHAVTIDATSFGTASLTVKVGDTIVWTNKDLIPHTVTSKAGGFDSGVILAGKAWSYTPKKKGDFAYICTFHPTMKAALKVE